MSIGPVAETELEKQRIDGLYAKALKLGLITEEMPRSHFKLQLTADEASATGVCWIMGYGSTGKSTLVDDLFTKPIVRRYRGVVQGRSSTNPNSFIWLPYLNPINDVKKI